MHATNPLPFSTFQKSLSLFFQMTSPFQPPTNPQEKKGVGGLEAFFFAWQLFGTRLMKTHPPNASITLLKSPFSPQWQAHLLPKEKEKG
jgi:hypothetical protein